MVSFASDYIAGAHPEVLKRLCETNMEALPGYGSDKYCESAAEKIRSACNAPDADVYFITGGTQTNEIVISTMLENWQGVISAKTGHIHCHEAGAVEYTGKKVIEVPGYNGKVKAEDIRNFCETFYADENHEHMVFPGMVYISFPTEYGTIYSKSELSDIYAVCKEFDMKLFVDGARLGYGISSLESDVSLSDMASLCDVFYIGGTKVGALCGEAVVFTHHCAPKHFVNQIKKHGALIAKGRLLGVQFDALFTDDLYLKISKHAIHMAEKLKSLIKEKNIQFFLDSPTNQQFVVMENSKLEELSAHVVYGFWEKYDDTHTVIRFATSWSTTEEDIETLAKYL